MCFHLCVTWRDTEGPQSSVEVSPCLNEENQSELSVFAMALSQNAVFEHSMHFQYRFLDCKAQLKAYALFIRKWQIVHNRHNSKHILRRNAEYYGCKK